jgi:hypothetical protein
MHSPRHGQQKRVHNSLSEAPQNIQGRLNSEQGNFAVMFALTIMFVLTLMAWVLDTGFFLKGKNRYQNCAEAAAMAAVNNVCFTKSMNELENLVMDVVRGSNLDIDEDEVLVETGYYDAFDEYEPFGEYKDFIARHADGYPENETWNAVMVTIDKDVESLTGFHKRHGVKGAAVAFLPRVSMVSQNGEILYRWGTGGNFISFNNGNVYGQKNILLRNLKLADTVETATGDSGSLPESPLIKNHLYSLETLIRKLKRRADKIYTMADLGKDAFYSVDSPGPDNNCYFDFTYDHDSHKIIFIDLPKWDGLGKTNKIYIDPFFNHSPEGDSIKNLTIVTDRDIIIPPYDKALHFGDREFEQLNIISRATIEFNTPCKKIQGINFISHNFKMLFKQGNLETFKDKYMRIITESDILLHSNFMNEESDLFFKFGPPCPPIADPVLGLLEPVQQE